MTTEMRERDRNLTPDEARRIRRTRNETERPGMPAMTQDEYDGYHAETMRLAALVDDCQTPDGAYHTARERLHVLERMFERHWREVNLARRQSEGTHADE